MFWIERTKIAKTFKTAEIHKEHENCSFLVSIQSVLNNDRTFSINKREPNGIWKISVSRRLVVWIA